MDGFLDQDGLIIFLLGARERQEVDVVYVATPHPQHFANVRSALLARKNVLCEKPFVLTGAQARELVELAREQGVFFMEAVWTRYQPVVKAAQEVVFGGTLGEVKRVDSRCVFSYSFFFSLLGQRSGV